MRSGICGTRMDDIDAFVSTIRPPRARQAIAPDVVERGRELFIAGGCNRCHGGQGWTVSRRFFVPTAQTMIDLAGTAFEPPDFFADTLSYPDGGAPRNQVSAQPPVAADQTGRPSRPGRLAQMECVLPTSYSGSRTTSPRRRPRARGSAPVWSAPRRAG